MAEKLGTDKVKEGLHIGFLFWKQTKEALSDNKFDLKDAIGYLDEVLMIPGVVATGGVFIAQSLDLDTTERAEINTWAEGEFPNETPEQVKNKVKVTLDWLITTLIAYSAYKPVKPVPPAAPIR